jgi:uncharacterized membrane protein
MDKKAVTWLYGQLPDLVAKGVLTAEAAERIRGHYGPLPRGLGRWTLLTVFGFVGAVLLGLGIILILGHNWDRLDHVTRLLISVGQLLVAQAAAAFALLRRRDSRAWTEGTAAFLALSVGACIALVGQTYHLVDDFKNFLLVWMLLSLPLVYLLEAEGVASMYLAGVVAWLASVQGLGAIKYAAWGLMALALPYYARLLNAGRYNNPAVVLSWLLLLCFYGCFTLTGDKELWKISYALLFSATYLVGLLWFAGTDKGWQKPYQVIGVAGSVGLAFILSFKAPWLYSRMVSIDRGEYLTVLGLIVLVAGLGVLLAKRKVPWPGLIAVLPLAVGAGYMLQAADKSGVYAAVFMSLYLLAVSLGIIRQGVRENRLGLLNAGMLMLAALILLRFFDFSYSFMVRGAAFIVVGAAFLAVNVAMARRKDGGAK